MASSQGRIRAVWAAHLAPQNMPLSIDAARDQLWKEQPAWLLDQQGDLIASNQQMLELWRPPEDGRFQPDNQGDDRRVNVFALFAASYSRVPVQDNTEFWRAKLRVEWMMLGDSASPFDELRQQSSSLKELGEHVRGEPLGEVWSYSLTLHSVLNGDSVTLDFDAQVSAVTQDGAPAGYFAVYEPTSDQSWKAVRQWIEQNRHLGRPPVVYFSNAETAPASDAKDESSEAADKAGKGGKVARREEREVQADLELVQSRLRQHWVDAVARQWLEAPSSFLGGARPIDLIRLGQAEEVLCAIEQLESGALA